MAVPKKRTSKSKSKKAIWKRKALLTSAKSLSLAKSLLTNQNSSFIYFNKSSIFSEEE